MAYLDSSGGTVTLTLTLTDEAKKKIALGGVNSLNIVKFALGDDDINYTLGNDDILLTPIEEPITNSNFAIQYHLVTRDTGSLEALPLIEVNPSSYTIKYDGTATITPTITNLTESKYTTTFSLSLNDTVGISVTVDDNIMSTKSTNYSGKVFKIKNTGVRTGKTIKGIFKDNLSGATTAVEITLSAIS